MLCSESGATNQRRTATDDSIGAHHPQIEVGDVHGTALAVAYAGAAAEQLRHHPVHVYALGNAMAVSPVR